MNNDDEKKQYIKEVYEYFDKLRKNKTKQKK